jgi:hypothetical protein
MERRRRPTAEDTGEGTRGARLVKHRFVFRRSRRQAVSLAVAQSPAVRSSEAGVEQLLRMDFDARGPCLRKQMVHYFPLSPWTP